LRRPAKARRRPANMTKRSSKIGRTRVGAPVLKKRDSSQPRSRLASAAARRPSRAAAQLASRENQRRGSRENQRSRRFSGRTRDVAQPAHLPPVLAKTGVSWRAPVSRGRQSSLAGSAARRRGLRRQILSSHGSIVLIYVVKTGAPKSAEPCSGSSLPLPGPEPQRRFHRR
jgi:hypothetical protein